LKIWALQQWREVKHLRKNLALEARVMPTFWLRLEGCFWRKLWRLIVGNAVWESCSLNGILDNNSAFTLGKGKTTQEADQFVRSQDLQSAFRILASISAIW